MLRGLILSASVALVAACGGGGGGGSSGGLPGGPVAPNEYRVTITADRTALPLNIDEDNFPLGYLPSIGSAYTTTLYVRAVRERTNDPIPGGDEVFACNVLPGIESGALYYFDGDEEHRDEVTVTVNGEEVDIEYEMAFRSIVLGANAGGASFHFISSDRAGTATIRCSVNDPLSGEQAYADIQIRVGGSPTGLPAQIRVNKVGINDRALGWLFPQNLNDPTMLRVQAELLDESGQRVPNPSADNLRARLVGPAGTTAYLQSGVVIGQLGQYVTARSINGMAEFSIHSGSNAEILLVEIETDRADNNVLNGIGARVGNLVTVPVLFANPSGAPLAIGAMALEHYKGDALAYAVPVTGGIAPYSCQVQVGSALPAGLALNDCAISGSAIGAPGTYMAEISARDSAVIQEMAIRTLTVTVYDPVTISTAALPNGTLGTNYNTTGARVEASGGEAPLAYSATFRDAGGTAVPLAINAATGELSGTVPDAGGDCPALGPENTVTAAVTVTDANGRTATRNFTITFACP